jgi:hypothetical protein
MEEKPIPTRALSPQDRLLRDKLAEDIAGQSGRMDELARQLIALELAVPGLYATALKLVAGEKANVTLDVWLYLAFASWGLALALTLFGLFPRKYPVDPSRLFADDEHADGPFSIEGYFRRSARYKRRLLASSCGVFFIGICAAVANAL